MATTSERKRRQEARTRDRAGAGGRARSAGDGSTTGKRSTDKRSTGKQGTGGPAAGAKGGSKKQAKGRGDASDAQTAARRPEAPDEGQEPARARDYLRDAWAIALLVLAALSALGIYAQAAGVVGDFLDLLFRGLFGVLGFAAPVALAAGGLALLRDPRPGTPRIVIGLSLVTLGVSGLWHLAQGAPVWDAPTRELHAAAGWLGATVAVPLSRVAATGGTVVLLLPITVLGLLITTATPPRRLVRNAGAWIAERRARRAERREREALHADGADVPEGDGSETGDEAATTRVDADPARGRTWRDRLRRRSGPPLLDAQAEVDDPDEETATPEVAEAAEAETAPREAGRPTSADPEDEPASDTKLLQSELALHEPDKKPDGAAASGEADSGLATRIGPPPEAADYRLPDLARLRTGRAASGGKRERDEMTAALENTLAQFKVTAHVARISSGPTITRFELELGEGVRVGAVTKLADDIAYALATPEIRIVAPIPGKSAIGIEVPNRERGLITLGDVLRSPEAEAQHHPLSVGFGVDIAGNPVLVNLAQMPHILIAGATGSGKSVTMNGIVTSVLMRAAPTEARMILVDPKQVELNHYEGAPHLLTPVVTDPKRATEALGWTVDEMERRYERLALLGYRNIDQYNRAVRDGTVREPSGRARERDRADGGVWGAGTPDPEGAAEAGNPDAAAGASAAAGEGSAWEPMPYLLFVIDELADLMMVAPRDVESHIVRLAQKARAVGIHLVIATQRPSVDVITGLIKANVPSRAALAMATQADSRTILDQAGAEKLVGHGDMLFKPANASKPHRIQGAFVSEPEIEEVVHACADQHRPQHVEGIIRTGEDAEMADLTEGEASDNDLTRKAMELVVRSGLGSTSMLQRKLKVGFARAGRIMDELEELGVVGPSKGSKAREVLMTVDELEGRGSESRDAGSAASTSEPVDGAGDADQTGAESADGAHEGRHPTDPPDAQDEPGGASSRGWTGGDA
ncbi:FtsK/SpoIIIE family DNA translocase [Egibacter rhizosphaerae]|nr:DNA translocase FtsK [Egibacter rhizosphaerae]